MKNDFGLSKGLLSSVSSLLSASSKQKAEESKQESEKLAAHAKVASMRPLSIEDARVASYAAKAPERRVNDTITQLYTQSVAEHNAKAKAEAEAIKTAYGKMGAVAPVAEQKLSPKQKKIAAVAGDKTAIDAMDFKVLRDRKKAQTGNVSDEKILDGEEIVEKDIGKHNNATTGFKALVKKLTPKYGAEGAAKIAGAQKKKMMAEEEVVEETDTPGNSQHQCAIHVKHAKLGEGRTLTSQHAQPDEQGQISWYAVMFEHGIEKVETKDLEILESEWHNKHPYSKSSKKMGIKPKN